MLDYMATAMYQVVVILVLLAQQEVMKTLHHQLMYQASASGSTIAIPPVVHR